MRKTASLLINMLFILFFFTANAQTNDRPLMAGMNFGLPQYSGDMGNGFFSFNQPLTSFLGITVQKGLTDNLDLVIDGSYGTIQYTSNVGNKFSSSFLQSSVNLKYNFKTPEDALRPYVFGGIGWLRFPQTLGLEKDNMQLPAVGVGVSYKYNDDVTLFAQEKFIYSDYDAVEGLTGGAKDMYLFHTIGVMFRIGNPDRDGDGVLDKDDLCPDVAGLAQYNGCPDSDGDGVIDKNDACPDVKGKAELNGCPDRDGDGVIDSKDACPDQKGLEKYNGCPDSDGDGIIDKDDACPNEKGLAQYNGCPDTDGDGIIDKNDACPNQKGLEKYNGCPDTDGDGIIDKEDACPTVAGIPQNNGCPKIEKKTQEVFQEALHGIKFASNSDKILPQSYPILDNIVDILKRHPEYKLKIIGHTDSQGDDQYNLELSKKRAEAVKAYLVSKGIDASRLIAIGKGETEPVADNSTAKGRALNRRVEFEIVFR